MNTLVRAFVTLLGVALLTVGAVAVFETTNGSGSAAMLAIGAVLVVLGVTVDRLESFEFGNAKLHLRAAAAAKYAEADAVENAGGDPVAAEELRSQARSLIEAADPLAARYASIRASSPSGPGRTQAMEQVLVDARRRAAGATFAPSEVIAWLRDGDEERRIVALAMMQERPEFRDDDLVLEAIAHPRSPFEQYHAMRLMIDMLPDLDGEHRHRLVDVVTSQRHGLRFKGDTGRWHLSRQILDRLAER